VPEAFACVTLDPLSGIDPPSCGLDDSDPTEGKEIGAACLSPCETIPKNLRLYFGAAPDPANEGIFSYAPCIDVSQKARGFRRPVIKIDGVISPNNKQACKLNPQGNLQGVVNLWRQVADQVVAAGLLLGVSFRLPPRR
jgi:hypothetical protein